MAFNFEDLLNARPEKRPDPESQLHTAYADAKERLEIALDAHTELSDDTKQMVRESLAKAPVDVFMSEILDRPLAVRYDNKNDDEKAANWLANHIAQDVMPRFAQNADHYADSKQANTLLTFLRGTII